VTRFTTPIDRRALLAGTAALGSCIGTANAQAPQPAKTSSAATSAFRSVEIDARKLSTFSRFTGERRHGSLEFRGGLVLTSADKDVGGLSGLVVEPDGKGIFAAIDSGSWLTGTLTYDGAAPAGITAARIGQIVSTSGRALSRRRDVDAEAAALLDGTLARGTLLIAFERNHRIGRFPIIDRVLQAPTGYLKMPPETRQMTSNKGLEAVTMLAGGPNKGAVVALAERFVDTDGHHTGWIWIGGEPRRFRIADLNEFDLTDCASLPDGTLLVLERRFRWTEGVKMQLRQFAPEEIAPGTLAKGKLLLAATMSEEIDNMEGLAIHRDARGATVLTLVSDDNFNSFLQRTLLLQFTLL
jgi:hypothetical protein